MITVLLFIVAFLAGSIPFGYIFAKSKGIEIRKLGSGNIGATNVSRYLGKKIGAIVFILDFIKGALPAFLGALFSPLPGVVGLGAILGHVFTPWLGFRGGKGMATSIGVFLVLVPKATWLSLGVWVILFLFIRIVAVSSMGTAVSLPVFSYLLGYREPSVLYGTIFIAIFIIWTHRDNIKRIAKGEEKRYKLKK